MSKQVVILGGGIAGLSAAYHLENAAKARGEVLKSVLLERTAHLGGLIRSERRGDFLFEHGPDCFISEKPAGLALVRELGLESQLIQTRPEYRQSFIFDEPTLHAVPEGLYLMAPSLWWPFLKSPLLSWRGKLRAGLEPFIPKRVQGDDESLASFVRRRLGQEMLDKVAAPMMAGIYTADPEEVSLRATMPQFLDLEQRYGSLIRGLRTRRSQSKNATASSGARYSLFVSFKDGMSTLIDALAKRLTLTDLRVGEGATGLSRNGSRWTVHTARGALEADELVLALPAYESAELLSSSAPDLSDTLGGIPFASSALVGLAFSRSALKHVPQGAGFVFTARSIRTMMACSILSQKFSHRSPNDDMLVLRCFVGGRRHGHLLDQSDAALINGCVADLDRILGVTAPPLDATVQRWEKRMPQYIVGHQARMTELQAQVQAYQGLKILGNAYQGVGVPDVVAYARAQLAAVH